MRNKRITLSEAKRFHGHLGPYLILGIIAGELAVKKLRCRKYFGLSVKAWGANKKPKSCLIDGLQLSTGATYGKGNIDKLNAKDIRIIFYNLNNKKRIAMRLKENLKFRLEKLKNHRDSESLAKKIYQTNYSKLFNLNTHNP